MVAGAGVIGLSCAVRLLEADYQVNVFARDLPLETTSAVAAALWYPYLAAPQDRVREWARTSYAQFQRLAEDPASGVRMVTGTQVHRAAQVPDPWWAAVGPQVVRVSPPAGWQDAWQFPAPIAAMPNYLRWLTGRVEELGGTITRMALTDLPRPTGVLVNATGLGAVGLAGDHRMESVRGQVLLIEQVGLDRWWLDDDGPTYLIPRLDDIVVGGSQEPGEWSTVPDRERAEAILDRATALVPELSGRLRAARVLAHKVGRRPFRPTVRVERERLGATDLVHCYGHGGAGVTLSWGCADEVLRLIRASGS